MKNTPDRVAIIGGGPAGLSQARALQKKGIPFTIFETKADFGGLWNRDQGPSPLYDSAHLISSRTMTGFDDYPMPESWGDYPAGKRVLDYIRAFATEFDLYPSARFNTPVTNVTPVEGGFKVDTGTTSEHFRWLVAANGSNSTPFLPHWPGTFSGKIEHASSFRNAEGMAGQNVLVVGLGNSGADIACDISRHAATCAVSLRRGYHVIPKHILGKPADVFADTSPPLPFWLRQRVFQLLLRVIVGDLGKYNMPKPDHRLMETHPLLSDQFIHHLRHGDITILGDIKAFDGDDVVFTDGHRAAFDRVICATGYIWDIPYIAPELLPWQRGRLAPPLSIFPNVTGLFLLSFVESNGSTFSLFSVMSAVIANAISDQIAGNDAPRKLKNILQTQKFDLMGGLKMQNTDRHVGYFDNKSYRKALAKLSLMMGWT